MSACPSCYGSLQLTGSQGDPCPRCCPKKRATIPVPRETLERVRGTLARLAHLEAAGHRAGLMSNDSRAALEDLDRMLGKTP